MTKSATKEMTLPRFVPSSKSMGTLRYISRFDAHLRYPRRIGALPMVYLFMCLFEVAAEG